MKLKRACQYVSSLKIERHSSASHVCTRRFFTRQGCARWLGGGSNTLNFPRGGQSEHLACSMVWSDGRTQQSGQNVIAEQ